MCIRDSRTSGYTDPGTALTSTLPNKKSSESLRSPSFLSFPYLSAFPSAGSVSVLAAFAQLYLAPEHSIDKDEISESENHSYRPPHEADTQPVRTSCGVVDGQAIAGFRACGQHVGIEREGRSHQHAYDVGTRRQKCAFLVSLRMRIVQIDQTAYHQRRDQVSNGPLAVIVQHVRDDVHGGDQAGDREQHLHRPEQAGNLAGPRIQFAFGLDCKVKRSVDDQRHQCDYAADDGVPVEDAVLSADPPIRPQRLEEIAIRLQGNAAHHVAQSGSEEDG